MERFIPNLRHLKTFLAVNETRSISNASRIVHLSQPAISHAIEKFEKSLGVLLFTRKKRGMEPTEAGRLFATRVKRADLYLHRGIQLTLRKSSSEFTETDKHIERVLKTVHLKCLMALSDAHNFTKAAAMLNVSQPSVSRPLRELEILLSVRLTEQEGREVNLTPSGKQLEKHARLAFREIEQGVAEIDALYGNESGTINIGAMPLARTYLLPAAINHFVDEYPCIRVRVFDEPYAELSHKLQQGRIDMIIGALRHQENKEEVESEVLFEDPLSVVARRGHPLSNDIRISARTLRTYPWVVLHAGTANPAYEKMMKSIGSLENTSRVEASSLTLIRETLVRSDRLSLISTHQIRRDLELGILTVLSVGVRQTSRLVGITSRRDWSPTTAQKEFLDSIRRAAEKC